MIYTAMYQHPLECMYVCNMQLCMLLLRNYYMVRPVLTNAPVIEQLNLSLVLCLVVLLSGFTPHLSQLVIARLLKL